MSFRFGAEGRRAKVRNTQHMNLKRNLSNIEDSLIESAIEVARRDRGAWTAEENHSWLSGILETPEWELADTTHDWRNHVMGFVKDIWNELPLSAKLIAYMNAESEAFFEEYE